MTRKKEYAVLILIIVGLALFIWRDRTDHVHYTLPEIRSLAVSDISKLELTKDNATLTLDKVDQKWIVRPGDFPADEQKVDRILQAVAKLELNALASEGGHASRYGLDKGSRVQVRVWQQGDQVRSFQVGKTASTYNNTYIRLADNPAVYLAESDIRRIVDQDKASLRDKEENSSAQTPKKD